MQIDIMTLFPEMVRAVMQESIIGRAQQKGLVRITAVNIRDYALNKHRKTDDAPYGGGCGQILSAEPLYLCHQALCAQSAALSELPTLSEPCALPEPPALSQPSPLPEPSALSEPSELPALSESPAFPAHTSPTISIAHTVLLSAQGQPFTQDKARTLLKYSHLILVCGHYEGVDQRFIDACVDEEISIGDFVLTGGELPAMVVADAICRMIPGVLREESSFVEESHWDGLLEYPQYTRPEHWRGRDVPEVLLSGHHAHIAQWRREESLRRTKEARPDLYQRFIPRDKQDHAIIQRLAEESGF